MALLLNNPKPSTYDLKLAFFLFSLNMASSIAGQNLIRVFGCDFQSSILIYPLSYMIVAALTELYGFRYTRSVIWTITVCNLFIVFIVFSFTKLPSYSPSVYVASTDVYRKFCGRLVSIITMGTIASLAADYSNAWIIAKLRILMRGRYFIFRALISITAAVIIDAIFILPLLLSRHGVAGVSIVETALDTVFKIGYEILILPICWFLVEYINYKEGRSGREMLPKSAERFSSVSYLQVERKLDE